MISIKHLKIYQKYNGDSEALNHLSKWFNEDKIMNYKIWSDVQDLIQDIKIVNSGIASEEYLNKVEKKLNSICEDEETILYIKKIAETL